MKRENGVFPSGRLCDCSLYVRKDLTVVEATEWYYAYVGENSYLPVCDLLYPQDGKLLLRAASGLNGELELITGITNRREGYRSIYLRMENSGHTEQGRPLYHITLFDIRDMENRTAQLERTVAKYRRFMSLNNQYYFEYTRNDNLLIIYKYINDKSMQVVNQDLDGFEKQQCAKPDRSEVSREQIGAFCSYLRCGASSFEMEFMGQSRDTGQKLSCRVRGGTMNKDKNMVAGILVPGQLNLREAYYLTPAARDAGTGLLNKKAATEYTVEKLDLQDGRVRWLVMMDVDDFKSINDRFGHLFGDEVIRKVADVLQQVVGNRGIIGRFGGDEYYLLLEEVRTREELKTILKTIAKQLYYAYDPKLKLTVSVGVSQYPKDGAGYEMLLGKADKALYIAKEKGKNRHIIYEEELHGSCDKDNLRLNAASYAVSSEKRTVAIIEVLNNLYTMGLTCLEDGQLQNRLREVFDLDGITVFTDYGKKLVCRSGEYPAPAPDAGLGLGDESFTRLFGERGVLVESNMLKLKAAHPAAYREAMKMETGATIQCIARKDGVPFTLITFDVMNRSRKWSDTDIEMLSIIGGCLGKLLCGEDAKGPGR